MPRLAVLLLSFYGVWTFAQGAEIVSGGSSGSGKRESGDAQLCRDLYEAAQCKEYFKDNPQNAKFAVNCEEPPPYEEGFKACGASIKGVFWDTPASVWNSGDAKFSYYGYCAQSYECKRALWEAQFGSPPDEGTEQRLRRITSGPGLEAMLTSRRNLENQQKNEKIREIWLTEKDPAKRDEAAEKIDPQWKDRKPLQLAALWQAALRAAHDAGHDFLSLNTKANCYSGTVQAEAVCRGWALMIGGGAAGKAGRALAKFEGESAISGASRILPTGENGAYQFTDVAQALGLTNKQKARIVSEIYQRDPESMPYVTGVLAKVANDEPLTIDEATEAGKWLNRADVRGVLAFHGTHEENLPAIRDSGVISPGATRGRVYAFPYNPRYGNAGGTNIGKGVVVFQGQAAELFSDRIVKGPWSFMQHRYDHQTTSLGRMIIEESKMVDGTLVVTRARIESAGVLRDAIGLADDMTDLTFTAAGGALIVTSVQPK